MRGILLGAVILAALPAAANAADIYVPAAGGYKDEPVTALWSGPYAGVDAGLGWTAQTPMVTITDLHNGSQDSFGAPDPAGFFGGGQIGYNLQGILLPHLVIGVEADVQGGNVYGSILTTPTVNGGVNSIADVHSGLDWFATVRGRVGYAVENMLFFGTGGAAFGGVHDRVSYSNGVGSSFDASKSQTESGYAAGAGVEYAINHAWSLKFEYQYIALGDTELSGDYTGRVTHPVSTSDLDHDYHTFKAGLNFHVLPGYEPLK